MRSVFYVEVQNATHESGGSTLAQSVNVIGIDLTVRHKSKMTRGSALFDFNFVNRLRTRNQARLPSAYILLDKRIRSGGDHMNALEAIEFAQELLIEYGLTGWQVELDRAVRRFGRCSYIRKLITLSEALVELNDQAQVLDVILHEIAYALAGPGTHHGPEWRRIARALGCSAERCYSPAAKQPRAPLVLRCPHCGHSSHRIRRPRRALACSACCGRYAGGRFDARFLLSCEPAAALHPGISELSHS